MATPTQHRTWINDTPDLLQQHFTGLKTTDGYLSELSTYIILDGYAVLDFNNPTPLSWTHPTRVLPAQITNSQLAIIDGYSYLFGGVGSSKIYRAELNDPGNWQDTGANLPSILFDSQLAVIDGYIYLFGGDDGYSSKDTIYSAPTSNPLDWTNHGALLPKAVDSSQLGILNGNIYLFGGLSSLVPTDVILSASISDPLTWINTGNVLPIPLYASQLGLIEGSFYLFGGLTTDDAAVDSIFSSSGMDPTAWSSVGSLPHAMYYGHFFTMFGKGYLIGPHNPIGLPSRTTLTSIWSCNLGSPLSWIDTLKTLPGQVSEAQLAIIYDRIFIFGGNASTIIYTCDYDIKYDFTDPIILYYGDFTRTQYNATPVNDRFALLGFKPWTTSY
jgi:N-acetylneuraminic acid mutarotase